ncbi:MAG: hypothetical protein LBS40_00785 [Burkholderiales bacterium]|jgi:hypothetical protein|nr:hypothetical protein [Burkholderiales bacterium]
MKHTIFAAIFALLLGSVFISLPAAAAPSYIDYTDIWYDASVNPDGSRPNSGWGINIVQSGNGFSFIFATFFIYDPATGNPTWVTSQLERDSKDDIFTGKLYKHESQPTTTPFNPQNLNTSEIGSLTFTPKSPNTATLEYRVGGTIITRDIERQTLTGNVIAGIYWGSAILYYETCANPVVQSMTVEVKQSSSETNIIFYLANNIECHLQGTLTPTGRMAKIDNAKYVCEKQGASSPILNIRADVSNLMATTQGIEGEWVSNSKVSNGCKEHGRFSAVLY